MHWQNLNEKHVGSKIVKGAGWKHGRAWFTNFRIEWRFLTMGLAQELWVRPDSREVTYVFKIPLVSLYLSWTVNWKWLWRLAATRRTYATDRSVGFYVHSWAIWFMFWRDNMESRGDDPWYYNKIFDIPNFFLGRNSYKKQDLETHLIWIPLPEGEYPARATYQICTWKRPRWFATVKHYTEVDVISWHGLPHEGKGENAWDCGPDGLFGYSVEGHSLEKAIAKGVESTLEYRRRYDGSIRVGYHSPKITDLEGLKAFANHVAKCELREAKHPKWSKTKVHFETVKDVSLIHAVQDNHWRTLVVDPVLINSWEEELRNARKTATIKDED